MKNSELLSIGSLDACQGGILRGWFLSEYESAINEVRLEVDGDVLEYLPEIEDRPDVVEVHGGHLACGFKFDLSQIDIPTITEIGVLHIESGYDFSGKKYNYYAIKEKYLSVLQDLVMPEYYRSTYTLFEMNDENIIDHYLNIGIYKNFDPNPWFDSKYYIDRHGEHLDSTGIAITSYLESEHLLEVNPSKRFNTRYYFDRYPDIKNKSGIFHHYVLHGKREERQICDYQPPESVVDQTRAIADIEPECGSFLENTFRIIRYPKIRSDTYLPLSVLQKCTENIDVIVTVPFITVGGADLISTFVLKALQDRYDATNILLIVTDHDGIDVSEWVSTQSNVLVLQKYAKFQNIHEKVQSLHTIIGLLAPEKVININSPTAWKLIAQYGKQLSTVVDLYAYLFCFDYGKSGQKVGYITEYIRDSIQYLTKIFCDNKQIKQDIQDLYNFPKSLLNKFATVYVPFPDRIGSEWIRPSENKIKRILWTGRLSKQKGPEYLVEISKILRNFEFHVYGPAGDSSESEKIIAGYYPNILYRGIYSHLDEVAVSNYECYLSTSQWEGLPTVLIQMMTRGIPVVTSVVGGVEELANDNTAWLVRSIKEPASYVNRIRFMLINSDESLEKTKLAQSAIRERHSWSTFVENLEQLGFVPPSSRNSDKEIQDTSAKAA